MKPEAVGKYYIKNGLIKSTDKVEIFNKIDKPPIYEVIRVIEGVPLFLKDHLDRMFESAKMVDYDFMRSEEEIRRDIKELILKNDTKNLNVKLLSAQVDNVGKVFLVYFIESFYPPENYYKNGVHTILFDYERQNPNAKVLLTSFKEEVAEKLKKNQAFEALLVDKSGYIPEGSRSNLFFVKDNKIYTGSESEVLLGITRKYILKACKKLNIPIVGRSIHKDEISEIQGAFMSGTSNNVLPISSINDIKIDSVGNSIIKDISENYKKEMEDYIMGHKSQWI